MRPTFAPRKLEEVNRAYAAILETGYPCVFEGVAETLQLSRDADKSNWLIFLGVCDEAVTAGAGSNTTALPIRCTSNRSYFVTYAEAQTLIRSMRAWGFAAQANCWRLKDFVASAADNDDLRAIDLTEGWP